MKVGLIEKPGVLTLAEREEPKITKPEEVKIRVKKAGICGSDMHIFHGTNAFAVYPLVWGHEITGEVIEIGQSVQTVALGDHVVVEPIVYCGTCYSCRQGRFNACATLKVMGAHIDGGAQEYIVIPEKHVFIVPKELPWIQTVLVEPFTIGAQACLRGNVQPGDTVFVMGAGTIGLTIMTNAKILGAKVLISDIFDDKLEYAKQLGADVTINAKGIDIAARVKELTQGLGANVVIDAVCSVKSFEQAIDCASCAGRVVEMSFNTNPSGIIPLKLAAGELTILGSRHQTRRFSVVIDYLKQGKLPVDGFVTAEYPADRMLDAFEFVDKNAATVRKVVVSF